MVNAEYRRSVMWACKTWALNKFRESDKHEKERNSNKLGETDIGENKWRCWNQQVSKPVFNKLENHILINGIKRFLTFLGKR